MNTSSQSLENTFQISESSAFVPVQTPTKKSNKPDSAKHINDEEHQALVFKMAAEKVRDLLKREMEKQEILEAISRPNSRLIGPNAPHPSKVPFPCELFDIILI